MRLTNIDWFFIFICFIITLFIGLWVARKSGKDTTSFFLSGRNMPWWLLGISMVATTFSADTPNLVTDIVRTRGVSGNWVWWAFLLTGMLTVFVYAKLWRRLGIFTDLEFYELRYSGKAATFLRGFRAIYLGVFFNIIIMATVCLAGIKIGSVLLGFSPLKTLLIISIITVFYSSLGGLRGVIITDFFQFILAMGATIWGAIEIVNLPEVGGITNLLSNPNVVDKLNLIPDFLDTKTLVVIFILPIAVQWWSTWYPGAEPGGGGYVAQRMFSAKDEKNAVWATLLFNFTHYAIRPWPWILIALASLVVFPNLAALQTAFPNVDPSVIKDDLAYPAMLTLLPAGLLGLLLASLIAAFMSTISTHLNWGSSYIVNDFYKRFIKPKASEKELVNIGRLSTLVLMILAMLLALALESALSAFDILIKIGAGTGLIFILRWFWYRINAWSEVTAMTVSFLIAIFFQYAKHPFENYETYLIGMGITTICWVAVTFLTRPTDMKVLQNFYLKIQPGGKGWQKVVKQSKKQGINIVKDKTPWNVPTAIICMLLGSIAIYSFLFATGYLLYGKNKEFFFALIAFIISGALLYRFWKKLKI